MRHHLIVAKMTFRFRLLAAAWFQASFKPGRLLHSGLHHFTNETLPDGNQKLLHLKYKIKNILKKRRRTLSRPQPRLLRLGVPLVAYEKKLYEPKSNPRKCLKISIWSNWKIKKQSELKMMNFIYYFNQCKIVGSCCHCNGGKQKCLNITEILYHRASTEKKKN